MRESKSLAELQAGHKLMKIQLAPGQEMEIVTMIIECCSQEKTYLRCCLHPPFVSVGAWVLQDVVLADPFSTHTGSQGQS